VELKPCPFCGSTNIYLHVEDCPVDDGEGGGFVALHHRICCEACDAEGPLTAAREASAKEVAWARKGAADLWNGRSAPGEKEDSKVKPCPFCGDGFPEVLCDGDPPENWGPAEEEVVSVFCTSCSATGPQADELWRVKLWNTRSDTPGPPNE